MDVRVAGSPVEKMVKFLLLSVPLGFCAMSSLAQEAKAKAIPNTSAKDFSRDANECCFIVFFIFRCFFSLLLSVSLPTLVFLLRLRLRTSN